MKAMTGINLRARDFPFQKSLHRLFQVHSVVVSWVGQRTEIVQHRMSFPSNGQWFLVVVPLYLLVHLFLLMHIPSGGAPFPVQRPLTAASASGSKMSVPRKAAWRLNFILGLEEAGDGQDMAR